jgi:hypothetical protein
MSANEPEYSAWLWEYDGPMSMFDGTYEECKQHVEGVYERFDEYYNEQVQKYRDKPGHHPECIPKRPHMQVHRYIEFFKLRRLYKGY